MKANFHAHLRESAFTMICIALSTRSYTEARRRFALKWKNSRPKGPEGKPTPIFCPALPIEVWECVIDHLWDDHRTLIACVLVCRTWYPRSRLHILGCVAFNDTKQIHQLAKLARMSSPDTDLIRRVIFRGGLRPGEHRPVPHLGTFAAMLAGRLTNLGMLCVANADWQPSMLQPDVFLNLSIFTSITELSLNDVRMPSAQTFGQLVCALPNLQALYVGDLAFSSCDPDLKFNPAFFIRRAPHMKLTSLWLGGISMSPIIDFLVSTTFSTNLKSIFLGPHKPIQIQDVQVLGVSRLLQAAGGALHDLRINVSYSDLDQTHMSNGGLFGIAISNAMLSVLLRRHSESQLQHLPGEAFAATPQEYAVRLDPTIPRWDKLVQTARTYPRGRHST